MHTIMKMQGWWYIWNAEKGSKSRMYHFATGSMTTICCSLIHLVWMLALRQAERAPPSWHKDSEPTNQNISFLNIHRYIIFHIYINSARFAWGQLVSQPRNCCDLPHEAVCGMVGHFRPASEQLFLIWAFGLFKVSSSIRAGLNILFCMVLDNSSVAEMSPSCLSSPTAWCPKVWSLLDNEAFAWPLSQVPGRETKP